MAAAAARHWLRFAKLGAGIALLALATSSVVEPLVFSSTERAQVSAEILTISAPIEGIWRAGAISAGKLMNAGDAAGTLENRWLDDSTVAELQQRLRQLDAEITATTELIAALDESASSFQRGTARYAASRVAQLRSLIAQTEANLEGERAHAEQATSRLARLSSLREQGLATELEYSEGERDTRMATQRVVGAAELLADARARLEVAKTGVNLDSTGTGIEAPYSKQRLDEIKLEITRTRRLLDARRASRGAVEQQLSNAKDRLKTLSEAELAAPKKGRVWRVYATPGSFVSRGSPLLSLVDCERMFVAALVSGRVFNRLKIGTRATFSLRGQWRKMDARVVQLSGSANSSGGHSASEDAHAAHATREDLDLYRVLLEVPELARDLGKSCTIGQPGEVAFDTELQL